MWIGSVLGSTYQTSACPASGYGVNALTCSKQCRIEDVGPFRRCDQYDARLHVEAVHLDEKLVERLLALVVTTAETGTAMATDGVDLVDEDDRRAVGLGLLEQVAHARRA